MFRVEVSAAQRNSELDARDKVVNPLRQLHSDKNRHGANLYHPNTIERRYNQNCVFSMKRILLLLCAVFILGSCAKKISFSPSAAVPGATGAVKIKRDKNENYAIELNVRNLPEPEDLQPPKRSYTVWVETNDNRAQNIGNLDTSVGLFSKTRKGELETVSAHKPVRIFITPEDSKVPQIPGAEPILNTKLFRIK